MASDLILIWITWTKLSRNAIRNRDPGSFAYVLLRDGTAYFVALCILNALHLTLTLLSFEDPLANVSVVTFFTEPLTAIIVSRFLINLQSANVKAVGMGSTQDNGGQSESLVFERVIGSLGSSIVPSLSEEEQVEDEHVDGGEGADADVVVDAAV
ncbi:hypothetical protein L226DRAFT_616558 [Lentinus tigrinus ALCF2SS1-7]|uniref:uncharacterized protein n=1 Tax=Lentinus tigrinus ALCF2SS1-7 TaxID=1328758 RepID=UPI001166376A|nr:hypothetical protein L226DRAFT_616558 [Lentinus tigrinus ALCF2SS1-7]